MMIHAALTDREALMKRIAPRPVEGEAESKTPRHLNPHQFFHGTDVQLEPGQYVVPGAEVGRSNFFSSPDTPLPPAERALHDWMRSRVWVSNDPREAGHFAREAGSEGGGESHVYEVHPEEAVESLPTDAGLHTNRAKVLRRLSPDEWDK
jgi:hypothetical protein